MGNCIQKKKLTIVQGISIVPEFQVNECQVNEIKKSPKTFKEDSKGNYVWIKLHTNDSKFQTKQEEEGFIITTEESMNYIWLRKERNIVKVD